MCSPLRSDSYQPGIFATVAEQKRQEKEAAERRANAEAARQGLLGPDGKPLSPEDLAKRRAIPENRDFT